MYKETNEKLKGCKACELLDRGCYHSAPALGLMGLMGSVGPLAVSQTPAGFVGSNPGPLVVPQLRDLFLAAQWFRAGYYQPAGPLITATQQQQQRSSKSGGGAQQPPQQSVTSSSGGGSGGGGKQLADSDNNTPDDVIASPPQYRTAMQPPPQVQYAQQYAQQQVMHCPPPGGQYYLQTAPPPPAGGAYGELCYGPQYAPHGHAQAVAAAAYYHAQKVYATATPPPAQVQPPPPPPPQVPPAAFRRYIGPYYASAGPDLYTPSGSPSTQLVAAGPSVPAGLVESYPGPPYYAGYATGGPPPPCYSHPAPPPRSLTYIDAPYQPCPCPMQSCPKNVHTGPLIGNSNNNLSPSNNNNSSVTTTTTLTSNNATNNVNIIGKKGPLSNQQQHMNNNTSKLQQETTIDQTTIDQTTLLLVDTTTRLHLKNETSDSPVISDERAGGFLGPVAALPLDAGLVGPPSPARGSAGMGPTPSPAGAICSPPPPLPMQQQPLPLLTKVSEEDAVKRRPRIGKTMVRNNMLLANNILIPSQQHQQHAVQPLQLVKTDPRLDLQSPKEGFEETSALIKHENLDEETVTDLSMKKPPCTENGDNKKSRSNNKRKLNEEDNVKTTNKKTKVETNPEVVEDKDKKSTKFSSYKKLIKAVNIPDRNLGKASKVKTKTVKKVAKRKNVDNITNTPKRLKLLNNKLEKKINAGKKLTSPVALDNLFTKCGAKDNTLSCENVSKIENETTKKSQKGRSKSKDSVKKQITVTKTSTKNDKTELSKQTAPNESVPSSINNNNLCVINNNDVMDALPVADSGKGKAKCKVSAGKSGVRNKKGRQHLVKQPEMLVTPRKSLSNPKWSNGWSWEGEPFMGNVFLNSDEPLVTRTCYSAMRHIEGDIIRPRDCVFLKSGQRKVDLPFVAKVAALWENPEDGEMMMSLLWYYRPEHTEQGRGSQDHLDEVFASRHKDTNSVACIEDKCFVLTFYEYCRYRKHLRAVEEGIEHKNTLVPSPNCPNSNKFTEISMLLNSAPELILFCRKVYDFRQKRIMKNPS